MSNPVVEFENVTCRYGATTVLEGINLHLHMGQFAGVLGPSGAGKTTLLKVVLGLVKPVSGNVCVNGVALSGRPSSHVAYVPQIETVDWNFPISVEQAVLMGRTMRGRFSPRPSRSDRQIAARIMEQLGILELRYRHIRELSGGQQQRVFLARALVAEPDLLVLDEPTAGVDMKTQEDILHLLARLNHEGMTVLMTTHDLNAAAAHLPWVICLNRTLIAQGTPEQVFVPDTLNATYRGDIVVVRQNGMIFVQERPHGHTYHDVIPDPVLSHDSHPALPRPAKTANIEQREAPSAQEGDVARGRSTGTL